MNNIFQVINSIRNPKQIIEQITANSQLMSNPMIKNAVDMVQRGDSKGIEQLARNIAETKGINADEIFNQVKSRINF